MDRATSKVTIVGGGLAGPALALCLKKQHGIMSTVYESRSEDDEGGVNIALAPNALRVMQHIGVYDELRTIGYSYEEMSMTSARTGQQLGSFFNGSEQHYNFAALRIHRREVQATLRREARAQGIEIHFNVKLLRVVEETEKMVKLEFDNGEIVETEFAIAADGIYSRVRKHVLDVELQYSGFVGILGMYMERKLLDESIKNFQLPMFCFGNTGMVAVFPCKNLGTEIDMFSTFPYPARSREAWEALANNKEEKQAIMMEKYSRGGWPEFISRVYKEHVPKNLYFNEFFEVPPLERWSSPIGRVIVLGDAAHAMSPQGGQGAAMAFEDAETLAFTIARPNFNSNRPKYLRAWEQHRKQRVAEVKAYTDRNGKLRTPSNNYVMQLVKD
ncbi:FAD/NAD(P)-binding domain-containing protein [Hyaloscypha variabilis F]|uniref:FAD/NAD(P)-binding domain-containing protein n=1 Tax=Hyaloscypha variabilis (strain UAMH 11265 / GT02V1 / F) TaxID=1149755 RepID=A0A2J6S4T3_HYAVF|nr:FAD/NAD(P)-binding domain-containing protein [Hyaloscypha variabilis F]